jgi:hypothetical protein
MRAEFKLFLVWLHNLLSVDWILPAACLSGCLGEGPIPRHIFQIFHAESCCKIKLKFATHRIIIKDQRDTTFSAFLSRLTHGS